MPDILHEFIVLNAHSFKGEKFVNHKVEEVVNKICHDIDNAYDKAKRYEYAVGCNVAGYTYENESAIISGVQERYPTANVYSRTVYNRPYLVVDFYPNA